MNIFLSIEENKITPLFATKFFGQENSESILKGLRLIKKDNVKIVNFVVAVNSLDAEELLNSNLYFILKMHKNYPEKIVFVSDSEKNTNQVRDVLNKENSDFANYEYISFQLESVF